MQGVRMSKQGSMWMMAVAMSMMSLVGHAKKPPPPAAPTGTGVAEAPPTTTTDGPGALDDARKVAESYLRSLEGTNKGDDARNYLLGGLTLTAQDFTIPNWRIAKRDSARVEELSVDGAVKALRTLEKKGAEALNKVIVQGEEGNTALSQADAAKLLEPTRVQAQKFVEEYPLFAYCARVGKDVFWHPDNPWLKEIKKLPKDGKYRLELHRFVVEEKDGGKVARSWPLRVLRLTATGYDSQWKILPASDWDPNY
jgi:hypothetical protein